ncbi:hypothetical protein DFJ77DRAFT_543427 [Powellomyces hirtus]|nr:hypothetical protein DFJ77DRAFT_543427 [Powellomyces hirtus]
MKIDERDSAVAASSTGSSAGAAVLVYVVTVLYWEGKKLTQDPSQMRRLPLKAAKRPWVKRALQGGPELGEGLCGLPAEISEIPVRGGLSFSAANPNRVGGYSLLTITYSVNISSLSSSMHSDERAKHHKPQKNREGRKRRAPCATLTGPPQKLTGLLIPPPREKKNAWQTVYSRKSLA